MTIAESSSFTVDTLVLSQKAVRRGRVLDEAWRFLKTLQTEYFVEFDELSARLMIMQAAEYRSYVNSDLHVGYVCNHLVGNPYAAILNAACLSGIEAVGAHELAVIYRDLTSVLAADPVGARAMLENENANSSMPRPEETPSADSEDPGIYDRLSELDERFYALGISDDEFEQALASHLLNQPWVRVVPERDWAAAVAAIGLGNPQLDARRSEAEKRAELEGLEAERKVAERFARSPLTRLCNAAGIEPVTVIKHVFVDNEVRTPTFLDGTATKASMMLTKQGMMIVFWRKDELVLFRYHPSPNRETASLEEIEAWENNPSRDQYFTHSGMLARVPAERSE